jgi:hypothetical protein
MKSIGDLLDGIQIVMSKIPKRLVTNSDFQKAKSILDRVQEYFKDLERLITSPGFEKVIRRLEHSSIEEVNLEAHQIENLMKDLRHMLYETDLYIRNLWQIVIAHPEQWAAKSDQLTLMIDQKFGGEYGELRKEFTIILHTEEELEEIQGDERRLRKFLK